MPAYLPTALNVNGEPSSHELRERERMARLTFALRHGNANQRRRALGMKLLPLPADPEAVAVAGVAVLDLPHDEPSSEAPRTALDALEHVAARYGGVPQDAEGGDSARGAPVDLSAFMEVLCPDGTSLLESLPLTPCENRSAEAPQEPPAVAAMLLASPPAGLHTRAPSAVVVPPYFPRDSEVPQPDIYSSVDEPLLLPNDERVPPRAAVTENAFATLSPRVEERVDAPVPQVFVSGGAAFRAKPRRSSGSILSQASTRRSASMLSRSANPDAALSPEPSGPFTPMDPCTPTTCPLANPPRSPFVVGDKCELGGRVVLTDRLVKSQSRTALPVMISAFDQYVRATAQNSDVTSQPSLRLSTWQAVASAFHVGRQVLDEEDAMNLQRLAPRQRGIPLECYNTDNKVLLCVRQAEQCMRPTFRRVDPAKLYGTSHYVSGSFLNGRRP